MHFARCKQIRRTNWSFIPHGSHTHYGHVDGKMLSFISRRLHQCGSHSQRKTRKNQQKQSEVQSENVEENPDPSNVSGIDDQESQEKNTDFDEEVNITASATIF